MSKRIEIGDLVRHHRISGGIGFVTGLRGFDSAHPVITVRFLKPVNLLSGGPMETYRDRAICWKLVSSCDIS
jgi:hypothetical protein